MNFISFHPIYQERVWGGTGIGTRLGRTLPEGKRIGESWEIVDRSEAQSRIAGGKWEGLNLKEALKAHGEEIMGPGYAQGSPFPILVKWLDCVERLSLQVHPPAEVASSLGGEAKTEMWYIHASEEGAALFVGLNPEVNREEFEVALRGEKLEALAHRVRVGEGDSMFVPSGRLHAIDAGNLILEIQQNSDTTYRVYDWGRKGLDGKPRALHVEESLKCIDFTDYEPPPQRYSKGRQILAESEEFRVTKYDDFEPDERLNFPSLEEPRLLHIVRGRLTDLESGTTIKSGDNILLPYSDSFFFRTSKETRVLITDQFC